MGDGSPWWPSEASDLAGLQARLSADAGVALAEHPWDPTGTNPLYGGCFVACARGATGAGHAGDWVVAAAVSWRAPVAGPGVVRRSDAHLRGQRSSGGARRADDVCDQRVVTALAGAPYQPGLLALRDGPVLDEVLGSLEPCPDVVLVDATGLDHPRGAGLAVHLGAALGVPTVGVTRRPLLASGDRPPLRRGECAPLALEGRWVASWVCTRTGAQPLVAHAAWRTTPAIAARVVLDTSGPAARTPVPLQEARRVARETRSLDHRATTPRP